MATHLVLSLDNHYSVSYNNFTNKSPFNYNKTSNTHGISSIYNCSSCCSAYSNTDSNQHSHTHGYGCCSCQCRD